MQLYLYFNPRAPCGARREICLPCCRTDCISTHAPLAGRDLPVSALAASDMISTHAPLAGRDYHHPVKHNHLQKFQPTRPLRGATVITTSKQKSRRISTHAPLAGRDAFEQGSISIPKIISTHAPLAGRDKNDCSYDHCYNNFNPRAPCGARLGKVGKVFDPPLFQPTRPLRGATTDPVTHLTDSEISTHAPLAGRDPKKG